MSELSVRQLVVFTLGAEQFGLPIHQVNEIVRYTEPRAVASRVPWVRGVISLRGRILPVFDLAGQLGVPCAEDDQAKIVIVEAEHEEAAGLIVDGVEEVLSVSTEQIEEVPGVDTALVEAVAKLGDRLIVLLKLSAILGAPETAPA